VPRHVSALELERLANDTGFKEQVRRAFKETEATLNSGLAKSRQAAGEQVKVRRQQFGDVSTAARQAELRAFVERTRQELVGLKNKANGQLGARRQQLIGELKEHVRRVAQAIATERGMDVVMLRTNNMLSYTEVSDITTAVLAKMSGESRSAQADAREEPSVSVNFSWPQAIFDMCHPWPVQKLMVTRRDRQMPWGLLACVIGAPALLPSNGKAASIGAFRRRPAKSRGMRLCL